MKLGINIEIGKPMKDNVLLIKTKEFALEIINLCSQFTNYNPLINQLLRSGTSIGANTREANYASSKADFVSKLHIALKECYETEYWLELLLESKMVGNEKEKILEECRNIKRVLVSSCKTAKDNETK